MGFNELNSVEDYIIHQLSGINLNSKSVQEPTPYYGAQRQFKLLKKSEEASMKLWMKAYSKKL